MKIGYARVSTDGQYLDRQITKLEEAGCEKVYSEKVSGAKTDREELENAFEHLRAGDVFVVHSLSRFGRSMKELVEKMNKLQEMDVDFESLDEGFDTTTAQGRFFFHVFAALAEFRRELISEGTREGLEAARERGNEPGRPPALEEEDIPQLQALMRAEDVSVSDILDQFDISKRTLYNYIGPDGERRR